MTGSADPIVLIEKIIPGGEGFGHLPDGRSLMVRGAFPGDRVQVTRVTEHAGFARAAEYELIEPSPDRRAPICSVAERCGGCDLMALEENAQQRAKLGLLREALSRVGRLEDVGEELLWHAPGPRLGYRSRLRLQVDETGRVGFFHRATRHLVVPEQCHVASAAVERSHQMLRTLRPRLRRGLAAFSCVEIRESDSGVSLFMVLESEHAYPPVESDALLARLREDHLVYVDGGSERAPNERHQLGPDCYMYSAPGAFTQVNWHVNLALIERVLGIAAEAEVESFCDLYSGSGNFALPLASTGRRGTGVESNAVAVDRARVAAEEQGLGSVRFVHADAAHYAKRAAKSGQRHDLVLLDPPRSGVKKALDSMATLAGSVIVMLSCDPVTFARDLARLETLGWRLAGIEAFDMFPQTHHLESLAWLFPL